MRGSFLKQLTRGRVPNPNDPIRTHRYDKISPRHELYISHRPGMVGKPEAFALFHVHRPQFVIHAQEGSLSIR